MRITIGQLRRLCKEAKVSAHPDYLKKEKVRSHVEKLIIDLVKSKEIADQAELDSFCETADMALKALKMVPIEVYAKMGGKKR